MEQPKLHKFVESRAGTVIVAFGTIIYGAGFLLLIGAGLYVLGLFFG